MKGYGWSHLAEDRLNQQDAGFWPSFADIMMLIVMIFLMVMMVLLVKNDELVSQLKSAVKTEATLAQSNLEKDKKNKVLVAKIKDLERRMSHQQYRIFRKQQDIAELELKLEKQQTIIDQKNVSLALADETIGDLQDKKGKLQLKLEATKRQVTSQNESIERLQDSLTSSEKSYKDLEGKYNKLIRPARSPKGKFVVEVTYLKGEFGRQLFVKEPQGIARLVSESELNRTLSRYQKRNPKNLYLKIVFPTGDLVSHQEAWRFTNKLLEKYDYYYQ